jgi:hypothetical protein
VLLYFFSGTGFSSDSSRWSHFGSYIGGTISPVLAFASFIAVLLTIRLQKQKNLYEKENLEAQVYCDNAVKCLNRAYSFLSDNGRSESPVKNRLVWLTTARLIKRAEMISNLMSPQATSSKIMYESEKDYWRHRFYELIDFTGLNSFSMTEDYFGKASSTPGDEIDERSIKIIYHFSLQFDDQNDPIDKVDLFVTEDLKQFHVSQLGLTKYLKKKIEGRNNR